MTEMEEHYCVRWKGFHSNIVSALEDLKSDEEFVDVTLSCDGRMLQGHKVILSASSPYFRKILKDNPCRHPVLILNDIQVDILEAIMTYMYHGTVSVPHNKLQVFLKSAEALKIKGIVDCFKNSDSPSESIHNQNIETVPICGSGSSSAGDVSEASQSTTGTAAKPTVDVGGVDDRVETMPGGASQVVESGSLQLQSLHHPAGDLSLLACAATELDSATVSAAVATASSVPLNNSHSTSKRRKTAPRKLGSYMASPARSAFSSGDEDLIGDTEKENKSLLSLALTAKDISAMSNKSNMPATNDSASNGIKNENEEDANLESGEEDRNAAINLSTQNTFAALYSQQKGLKKEFKTEESLDLSVKGGSYNPSSIAVSTAAVSQAFQLLPSQLLNGSSPSQLNLMAVEGGAAEQMAALLGPEQMAALLGPSWKSRQPRMCQYCNRMFSNKFNLKQHILNMHTVGREMQCEICNKKVKNKWYLRRHHVTHHGAPLKK